MPTVPIDQAKKEDLARALAGLTTAEADLRQAKEQYNIIYERYERLYREYMTFQEEGDVVRMAKMRTQMLEEHAKLLRYQDLVARRAELVEKLEDQYNTLKERQRMSASEAQLEAQAHDIARKLAMKQYPRDKRRQSIMEDKLYKKTLQRLRDKAAAGR